MLLLASSILSHGKNGDEAEKIRRRRRKIQYWIEIDPIVAVVITMAVTPFQWRRPGGTRRGGVWLPLPTVERIASKKIGPLIIRNRRRVLAVAAPGDG